MDLKEMVEKFIADGELSYEEHEELMEKIHADGKIDQEERALVSKIFKLIQSGELKVINPERDASEQHRKDEIRKKLMSQSTEKKAE